MRRRDGDENEPKRAEVKKEKVGEQRAAERAADRVGGWVEARVHKLQRRKKRAALPRSPSSPDRGIAGRGTIVSMRACSQKRTCRTCLQNEPFRARGLAATQFPATRVGEIFPPGGEIPMADEKHPSSISPSPLAATRPGDWFA